ncbi:hypothetical protein GWI33_011970 [Rhynchophorus ferrugineus]|uniref:Uncharacterized protein n=1 Tax=Rhynchophorus ferrugineus TaxID=354439 RepID=A0A834MN57_RHYFE|nr:hypothetical protein GWI33_011970 [Rhynchophorus ferrugineus]
MEALKIKRSTGKNTNDLFIRIEFGEPNEIYSTPFHFFSNNNDSVAEHVCRSTDMFFVWWCLSPTRGVPEKGLIFKNVQELLLSPHVDLWIRNWSTYFNHGISMRGIPTERTAASDDNSGGVRRRDRLENKNIHDIFDSLKISRHQNKSSSTVIDLPVKIEQ